MPYVLSIGWVAFFEELEDANLNVRGLTVFWNGADNLHSDLSLTREMCSLDDLSKGALAEKTHDAIWHEGRGVRRGNSRIAGDSHRPPMISSGVTT